MIHKNKWIKLTFFCYFITNLKLHSNKKNYVHEIKYENEKPFKEWNVIRRNIQLIRLDGGREGTTTEPATPPPLPWSIFDEIFSENHQQEIFYE